MRKVVLCAAAALAAVATIGVGGTAGAEVPGIVVEHGVTQPVFGYDDAIRERVFVDSRCE